jgi:hypothetical protein
MSNQLAIATVTATLQRVLQTSVQDDVAGARVTAVHPRCLADAFDTAFKKGTCAKAGVNLYLYLITPNLAYGSSDQSLGRPTRDSGRRVASDLQFLISFYGNEAELEPQRLAGRMIRTLQNGYVLTPDMIRETVADPAYPFLTGADLADQLEPVRVVPVESSMEELSKIWSVFCQTPYVLSLTYKATVVVIEGEDVGEPSHLIRERKTSVVSL